MICAPQEIKGTDDDDEMVVTLYQVLTVVLFPQKWRQNFPPNCYYQPTN
jgi:hypothetical protein